MKKLSLTRILEDVNQELEDFSAGLEGDDGDYQSPEMVDPQQVWGGPKLNDQDAYREGTTTKDLYSQYGISQQEMTDWVNQIKQSGFTPQLYQQIQSRVGDMDNFLLDVQSAMPQIHQFMMAQSGGAYSEERGGALRNEIQPQAQMNQLNRSSGRPIPTVQSQVNKLKNTKDDMGVDQTTLSLSNLIPQNQRMQGIDAVAQAKANRQRLDAQQQQALQRQQQSQQVVSQNPDGDTNPARKLARKK